MDVADSVLVRKYAAVVAAAGAVADAQGLLAHIQANREVLDQGAAAIGCAANEGAMHLGEALALLDCVKGLSSRHLGFESRLRPGGIGADFRVMVTQRSAVEQYLNERPRETAALSYHLLPGERLLVISAANYPIGGQPGTGRVEYQCALLTGVGDLLDEVAAYTASVEAGKPDLGLLSRSFPVLGHLAGALLGGRHLHEVILVPHKALHALPLHALPLPVRGGGDGLFLHDIVNSIRFASSMFDALTSDTGIAPAGQLGTPRLVSVFEQDSGLPGIDVERKALDVLRSQAGDQLRIATCHRLDEMPEVFGPEDIWVNWHGHGRSSSDTWGGSHLTLNDTVLYGRTIAGSWHLPGRPHVVLASCQSAVDGSLTSVVDEYCGLDVAFRIAGARSVVASMWDLSDPVAAFTALRLQASFLQTGKSPAHALTALQRAFRNGTWKAALLRPEQLDTLPADQAERIREFQEPFARLGDRAFSEVTRWATMRAHG